MLSLSLSPSLSYSLSKECVTFPVFLTVWAAVVESVGLSVWTWELLVARWELISEASMSLLCPPAAVD